jgi:hypothetical protein
LNFCEETYTDVGGTGIDVTLETGNGPCSCDAPGPSGQNSGALEDVELDLLFGDNQVGSPQGDFIITFNNLIPEVTHVLKSFHNRSDEKPTHIEGVEVFGSSDWELFIEDDEDDDRILQDSPIMDFPAEITFTPDESEVSFRYLAPLVEEGGAGSQAFLNGFILTELGDGKPIFHRGDADDNGELQLTDAIRILGFLFLGGAAPTCLDAADADNNGELQLTDAIRILGFLFLGGPAPADPGPPGVGAVCGPDDDEALGCASYTKC